jgi:hypothetical protein
VQKIIRLFEGGAGSIPISNFQVKIIPGSIEDFVKLKFKRRHWGINAPIKFSFDVFFFYKVQTRDQLGRKK